MLYRLNWISDEAKDGSLRIRARVRWDKCTKMCILSPGIFVDKGKWVKEIGRAKNNTTHGANKIPASKINSLLEKVESNITTIFSESDSLTPEQFRAKYDKITSNHCDEALLFSKAFERFIDDVGVLHAWTPRMYQRIRVTLNKWNEYNNKLLLDDVDTDTMQSFLSFLLDKEYNNSYIAKQIKTSRWCITYLHDIGVYKGNAHTFKPKLKSVSDANKSIVYLTWDELMRVYYMTGLPTHLEQVRDVFCLCCFTSLRYSDVAKLQRCDVKTNYIDVVTKKTADTIRIELNKYSRAILDKYKEIDLPNGKALPVISNQKMNDNLHELGKLAELDEPIRHVYFTGSVRHEEVRQKWEVLTSHAGRRTFVVNALAMGIPAEVVIKWTGHADYNAMKPYIAIVEQLKSSEMRKFDAM